MSTARRSGTRTRRRRAAWGLVALVLAFLCVRTITSRDSVENGRDAKQIDIAATRATTSEREARRTRTRDRSPGTATAEESRPEDATPTILELTPARRKAQEIDVVFFSVRDAYGGVSVDRAPDRVTLVVADATGPAHLTVTASRMVAEQDHRDSLDEPSLALIPGRRASSAAIRLERVGIQRDAPDYRGPFRTWNQRVTVTYEVHFLEPLNSSTTWHATVQHGGEDVLRSRLDVRSWLRAPAVRYDADSPGEVRLTGTLNRLRASTGEVRLEADDGGLIAVDDVDARIADVPLARAFADVAEVLDAKLRIDVRYPAGREPARVEVSFVDSSGDVVRHAWVID